VQARKHIIISIVMPAKAGIQSSPNSIGDDWIIRFRG
jgi:hypothetical protein